MEDVIVLGCSGSIGTQTLDVLSRFPDRFRISGLSAAGTHPETLIPILKKYRPGVLVLTAPHPDPEIGQVCESLGIKFLEGMQAQNDLASGNLSFVDIAVIAVSGTSGIRPTFSAVNSGIDVALANKETLVAAGSLVIEAGLRSNARIFPIDSEHSAIAQCTRNILAEEISRLFLTCSGGPFHSKPEIDLEKITLSDALSHPTWNMGRKITIDSATLMNKGLEMIEAKWLFHVDPDRIQVVIHPESVVHSMVELRDGSILAQMGLPDMRLPIQYALTRGEHLPLELPRLNFYRQQNLHFCEPDMQRFPCLRIAYEAIGIGGTMPAVMNAANESAVTAFCNGRIRFTDIPLVIERVMDTHCSETAVNLDQILNAEHSARISAEETIERGMS